jgi:hypothetical protein
MRRQCSPAHQAMVTKLMRRCAASPYRDAPRRIPPGVGGQALERCAAMRRDAPAMGRAHQTETQP